MTIELSDFGSRFSVSIWGNSLTQSREERREMIPPSATLEITKEEAERQLALYAEVRDLTDREKKMLAIYDAVVTGEKVIDLDEVLERADVRKLTGRPLVAVAPINAESVTFTRTTRPVTRKERRYTDTRHMEFSYHSDGWSMDLESRIYRNDWDTARSFSATARVPSILPTVRDKIEEGDLILWEPIWTDISERQDSTRSQLHYDPAVIRDIGNGLYQVVAAWDLTPVEIRVLGS